MIPGGFPAMTSLSGGAPIGDIGGAAGPATSTATSTSSFTNGGLSIDKGGSKWIVGLVVGLALLALVAFAISKKK